MPIQSTAGKDTKPAAEQTAELRTPDSPLRQDLEAIISKLPNDTYAGLSEQAIAELKKKTDLPANHGFDAHIETKEFGTLFLTRSSSPDGRIHEYHLYVAPDLEENMPGFSINSRGEVIHNDNTDATLAQKILEAAQNAVGLAPTVRDLKDYSFHPGD